MNDTRCETISFGDFVQLKILLVDDNRVNQDLAVLFLKRYGHHVVVASNGLEALVSLAQYNDFDIIFMDVQMPTMDGLTASTIIRACENGHDLKQFHLPLVFEEKLVIACGERHIPIVAMTANTMSDDRQKCLDAGMDDYLTKPFRQNMILRIILNVTEGFSPKKKNYQSGRGEQYSLNTSKNDMRSNICEHLKENFKLEDEEITGFLRTTCMSLQSNLNNALKCVENNDLNRLSGVAHSLKGSFLNLGLNDLAARARNIEMKSKQGVKESYKQQLENIHDKLSVLFTDELQ